MIPPYALEELEDGKLAYAKHIRDSVNDTFESVLGTPQGLLVKTYSEASKLWKVSSSIEASELLGWTFRLWMSIRLSTRSVSIVGQETLGMKPNILDETHPNHGKIPLPPVLGAQLDLILIHHIQTKLRRELLDKLQKLILKNKQSNWLLTYLVTFVLLHNAAMIIAHDASYARKHGMKVMFPAEQRVSKFSLSLSSLSVEFFNLIFPINKCANSVPFSSVDLLVRIKSRSIILVRFLNTLSHHILANM